MKIKNFLFIGLLFFMTNSLFAQDADAKEKKDPQVVEERYYAVLVEDYIPQSTPQKSFNRELELMSMATYCYDLPLFDAQWRQRGKKIILNKQFAETAKKFDVPYDVEIDGKQAVLYFPGRNDLGPVFFYQEKNGWVIDRTAVFEKIIYNNQGGWVVLEEGNPYFAILKRIYPLKVIAKDKNSAGQVYTIHSEEDVSSSTEEPQS